MSCLLVLAGGAALSQVGAVGDPAFTIVERLPGVESNGSNEFAPLAIGSTHLVLAGNTDIALFRKAVGGAPTQQIAKWTPFA